MFCFFLNSFLSFKTSWPEQGNKPAFSVKVSFKDRTYFDHWIHTNVVDGLQNKSLYGIIQYVTVDLNSLKLSGEKIEENSIGEQIRK